MASDILKMNTVELRTKAAELKKKLAEARFDKATGKLIDTTVPQKLRKDLARVLTRQSQVKAS
jgi:ribosomal protein L29